MSMVWTNNAEAQTQKAVISTPTIQCDMCKNKIEQRLKRMVDGVTTVKVDVKKKTTTVTYHKDRASLSMIQTAINNLGYDADDELANPEAYSKLPKCCKKPEDQE